MYIHVSAKTPNRASPVMPAHNGRYEIHNAPMVGLIASAYGFDADKILGGPSWLEMTRFDVIAKEGSR